MAKVTLPDTITTKQMDLTEFRELGLLQEVNRLFFHPRGLAMFVVMGNDGKDVTGLGVFDAREDPEGYLFGELTEDDAARAENARQLLRDRMRVRVETFGWVIQPLPGEDKK